MWWIQHDYRAQRRRERRRNIMKSDDDVEEWAEMAKQTKTEGIPRISSFHSSFSYSDSSFFSCVSHTGLHRLLLFIQPSSLDWFGVWVRVHWTILMSDELYAVLCRGWLMSGIISTRQWSLTRMLIVKQCRAPSKHDLGGRMESNIVGKTMCCTQKKQNMKMWSEFFLHHHHSLFHATVMGCHRPQATNKHDNVDDDKSLILSFSQFFLLHIHFPHFRSSRLMLFSLNLHSHILPLCMLCDVRSNRFKIWGKKRDSRLGEVLLSLFFRVFYCAISHEKHLNVLRCKVLWWWGGRRRRMKMQNIILLVLWDIRQCEIEWRRRQKAVEVGRNDD